MGSMNLIPLLRPEHRPVMLVVFLLAFGAENTGLWKEIQEYNYP